MTIEMRADLFRRIGGRSLVAPRKSALLQTDGSFFPATKFSRVAMILRAERDGEIFQKMQPIDKAKDSTETEWASVCYGLMFALEKNEWNLQIENDNLSVIRGLMLPFCELKHDYAKFYRNQILMTAVESYWTAIRWIPRELNRADALFRRKRS
jgi:ribonuclease HI